MRRVIMRRLGLALAVAAALSAIAAAAALANEGPFFKVAKARLEALESKNITGELAKEYVLRAGIKEVDCKAMLVSKAMIFGSSGPNLSDGEGTILFEKCTVSGNGTGCSVEEGQFVSAKLFFSLAFSKKASEKGETLLALVTSPSGVLATIKFTGATCIVKMTAVEGVIAAEDWNTEQKPVKLEETETEGENAFLNFPTAQIKEVWLEEEGLRNKQTTSLTMFEQAATIVGRTRLKLESKQPWGVFAK
jgi:hypothetical protein